MEGKEDRRASLKRTFSKHEKAMLGDLSCDNLNDLQRDALNEMKVELAEELGMLRVNQTNPTREARLLTYTYLPISVCLARSTRSRAARLLNTRYLTDSLSLSLSLSLISIAITKSSFQFLHSLSLSLSLSLSSDR